MPEKIRVTSETTAQQLQEFSARLDDNVRIKGKHNKDGSITLYSSNKRSGLWSRITGQAETKRQAARAALSKVMEKHTDRPRAFQDILSVAGKKGNHALRGSDFRILATLTNKIDSGISQKAQRALDGPGLSKLQDKSFVESISVSIALAAEFDINTPLDNLVEPLSKRIAEAVERQFSPEDKEDFGTSPGTSFKSELRESILGSLQEMLTDEQRETLAKSPGFKALLDEAYNKAAASLLPAKWAEDGNSFELGGEVYTKGRHLGEGAFGSIDEFQCGDKKVAVKTCLSTDPANQAEFSKEYRRHKEAYGEGHPNVLGVHGAMRAPNGTIGVILEMAPNKTVYQAMSKIQEALKSDPPKITQEQARVMSLTLLQDMAMGLKHMSEENGVIHGDFKAPNVFIGEGGLAKIADLGTAQKGEEFYITKSARVENPRWLAPEVCFARSELLGITTLKAETLRPRVDMFLEALDRIAPGLTTDRSKKAAIHALMKDVMSSDMQDLQDEVKFGPKSDTWALGVTAFNLFFGGALYEHQQMSKIELKLEDFGGNRTNQAITTVETIETPGGPQQVTITGMYSESSGDRDIDVLLNKLLSPHPDDRPSMDQLLADPIFKRAGVGSNETRERIVELMNDRL